LILKNLSLAGFKSFADRTRLEFEPGVNIVVGPNGSGKSNLLDALAWVMGTQATRVLRTQKMEDVIFAGTSARPALGRAEVNLTFENTDGFLPLDLAEITLTRRLYRDGTSEYEINGAACRLLDIQELLSDGGVGRHQHVLVGQGQIGDILNARPDEHRMVIEEAAGVTKHRARRDRAVRRLEQTAVDIQRLVDILGEQRRLLRPLKRQANAAERYEDVRSEARALRLWIGGEDVRRLRTRSAEAAAERQRLEEESRRDGAELARIDAVLEGLRAEAGEAGSALERDSAAAARLETTAERLQRIAMVARERRTAMEGRLAGAGERRADLAAEVADLEAEIARTRADEEDAAGLAEQREAALRNLEDEERSLAEQVTLPAEGVVAALRGDLRALESAAARDAREAEDVARRREVVRAQVAEDDAEGERRKAEIRETDAAVSAAAGAYDAVRVRREAAQDAWEAAQAANQDARMAAARAAARVEAIEAALAGLGDPEARRRAAEADEVVGTLVEALDVPGEVAVAVDAALGTWRQAFVTEGGDALEGVVTALRSGGFGGVGLVTRGEAAAFPARSVAAEFGVDALVDRLGPAADAGLAARLLGDVVIVEGWSTGWNLVRRFSDVRAVTPEGDVITAMGIYLAEADGAGPAALEAARVDQETADRDAARTASIVTTTRRTFDAVRTEERVALEALESLEARLAGATEALRRVETARSQHEAEISRLDQRRGALTEAGRARDERIAALRQRVEAFEGEEAVRQEAWDALNRRREEVARNRDEARKLREDAATAVGGFAERRKFLEDRRTAVLGELAGIDDRPVDPADIDRLAAIEGTARSALEHVRSHVESLRERQRRLREVSGAAYARLEEARSRHGGLERSMTAARDRGHALEVEAAELRVRLESALEGLRRDADATEEAALAAPRPGLPEGVDPRERYEGLEAQLRRMGPINPLAAAEYRELADHVELLEGQLADLEDSRREIRKVIAALDDEMADLFRVAFDEIAGYFEENFDLVFPGGKGRLRLADPDDPLGTGVEIEAQPLGKKIGRLSLLSGGERSLAALAFLFAVFRARPSPFYVLDEVEAALDDANLRRFLRLVDTLRGSAQLVVITHQQQTIEAADILYGVTMEPGGSSKVLAKRMSPARHRAPSAPAAPLID
jgi:chromosome segregation protein